MMLFNETKDPMWQVSDVLLLEKHVLDNLEHELDLLAHRFGVDDLIIDHELCGSYAFGCARFHSDIDINWTAKNWEDQRKIQKTLRPNDQDMTEFHIAKNQLAWRLKIRIDILFFNPDNKGYVAVYSLRERKLYGRPDNKPLQMRRVWNPKIRAWEVTPMAERIFKRLER